MKIYTIGHSVLTIHDFIKILISHKIKYLVDVRSYPSSKYVPQFNKNHLEQTLAKYHISYIHIPDLGGRRNFTNIHHPSIKKKPFWSYAEYMMTDKFKSGLRLLKHIARKYKTVIMCSEALWWKCHRRMISDRLEFDGWQVSHLGINKKIMRHIIWPIARLNKKKQIIYDQ